MKILEVRDGFIKYETSERIALSSFIQIKGIEKRYIAQIVQIKHAGENNIVYAKILFIYNGMLLNYDKTLPSTDSEITNFDFKIISQTFEIEKNICIGTISNTSDDININSEFFNKKLLKCRHILN